MRFVFGSLYVAGMVAIAWAGDSAQNFEVSVGISGESVKQYGEHVSYYETPAPKNTYSYDTKASATTTMAPSTTTHPRTHPDPSPLPRHTSRECPCWEGGIEAWIPAFGPHGGDCEVDASGDLRARRRDGSIYILSVSRNTLRPANFLSTMLRVTSWT